MSDPKFQKADTEAQATTEEVSVESAGGRKRRGRAANTERSVNMDELQELIQLIRDNEFTEFEIEREGFRVRIRRGPQVIETAATAPAQGVPAGAPSEGAAFAVVPVHPGAKAETAASEDQNLHMIPSPIVGTFYRSPSPNADSFVKIGSIVEPDTVVCIIEAMKLMNEITAETTGEVAKIYVENGQPVEYGQPLFGIKK
ncbi:MAG TPA: acetyl-CoA carboxylase biotin carboxyl carrier protein [Pyrinomonadaceae bacterium]|nr:acetyl-CoA carboxylase biotin carboxyl carrier protein [Pyrinomonadaceae bacterium]